tara:strand:- start:8273 stop:8443 length:171 start_codon:yes stop_codon:yes gene_type:complete
MALNEHEVTLINESIAAYKRSIDYIKKQIHALELKKLKNYNKNCPECFKIINKQEK